MPNDRREPPKQAEPPIKFRPRVGGRGGEIRGDGARLRRGLLGGGQHLRRDGERKGPRGIKSSRDVRGPGELARRCVLKIHYVKMNAYGQKAARLHLSYIERDGVERDGSKGQLFDAHGLVDREKFIEPMKGEERQFRFILAPEDGLELDLQQYTRDLVAQMEKDLGRHLSWAAVCHYNTDQPHVHIVVRGLDRDGQDLTIPKDYIQRGLRDRASELATNELGPRNEFDLDRQLTKEVVQERFTSLDRRLENLVDRSGKLELEQLGAGDRKVNTRLLGRLQVLERLRFARQPSPKAWQLEEGWQQKLRALGERGDVIKRMHEALRADPTRYKSLEPGERTPEIHGVLRRKGLHEELGHELFGIVETAAGDAYYLRLDATSAEHLREGQLVRVASQGDSWLKPTDRALAAVAGRNSGVYDPALHLAQLEKNPTVIRGEVKPAREIVEVNLRRLERLENYKLVERRTDGTWRVPKDLLQQLEARERSHPRHRLEIEGQPLGLAEQQTYRGPTWLDGQAAAPRAGYGFGAEVAQALQERAQAVQRLVGDLPYPARAGALVELERRDLGQRAAREAGAAFETSSDKFGGRLFACESTPSGRAYALVLDERRGRVAAVEVPSPAAVRNLEGRQVDITASSEGPPVLRERDLSLGR
jgi:type IV secretory pathway VirD2 relaxase